jgi:myosin heavy subunit
VAYDVEGFVEKNKDTVSSMLKTAIASSVNPLFKKVFPEEVLAEEVK